MDAIADFLSAIHVQGVCYGRKQVTGGWTPRSEIGSHAQFGLISYGQVLLSLPNAESIQLFHGDFFLLAPGREYVLSTVPGSVQSAVIAGRFSFDQTHSSPLPDFLPPIILIRGGQPSMLSLQKTLELLASEVDGSKLISEPGAEIAVRRLADLLLIQALRAHITTTEGNQERTGWLHALADSQIGAALNSMHKRIEHPWTVASLASEAGMSRSAFAQRFKKLMSETPLEYLTRWRMYRGSDLLRESDRKLADVAQAVGYDSDGAFHKAFKRVLGIAPGEYRRSVGVGQI
jgi:AraC-like DNA-binding protein